MSESQASEMEPPLQSGTAENIVPAVAQKIEDLVLNEDETKQTIRKKVWEHLAQANLVNFPKPRGGIPNFPGVKEASLKLLELPAFKAAKSVGVNAEKPLAPARELVLSSFKDLYVPFARFPKYVMKKLSLDEKMDVKEIISRRGIQFTGMKIDVDAGVTVDLLIMGSVAVSKDGYRVGKGGGFDDLEFAVFKEIKAVNDDTVIVTILHDTQVFDELPKNIFKEYDVPVDFIITPTRTIAVEKKLPRPRGIFWSELTSDQIRSRKLLKYLKEKHESEGKDTTLCVLNPEDRRRRPFYWRRFPRRKLQNNVNGDEQNGKGAEKKPDVKRGRQVKSQESRGRSNEASVETDNLENIPPKNKNKKKKKRQHIDYSLRVSNINKNIRAKEFKEALKEKGIKPSSLTWKGYRGVCFLHYAKKDYKKENEDSDAIDDVIEIIQGLKINPARPERSLSVKVVGPITRIETVDVTAV